MFALCLDEHTQTVLDIYSSDLELYFQVPYIFIEINLTNKIVKRYY